MLDYNKVIEARNKLKNYINETPLQQSLDFKDNGVNLYIKFENMQFTGSFKIRGALNKILNLDDDIKGIIAASAGNHAQGVAYGAKLVGKKATIVMPKQTPKIKIDSTKSHGANVILHGNCYDEAYDKAVKLSKEDNLTLVHPFKDEEVIIGQGTLMLDILKQLEDIDTIICPIGGGGLISGIGFVAKSYNPKIKVIGVQSESIPAMKKSIDFKHAVDVDYKKTYADGIAVTHVSTVMFDYVNKYVDEIVTVSEEEIKDGIKYLINNFKSIAEGSGAVTVAAVLANKIKNTNNTVAIISGGNIDMSTIKEIL